MLENKLELSMHQTLKITQKMLQSIEILQMDSLEITEYLKSQMEENPVMECVYPDPSAQYQAEIQKYHLIDYSGRASRWEDSDEPNNPIDYAAEDKPLSLCMYLDDQIDRLKLPCKIHALCKYLVRLLDENGYLSESDLDDLRHCGHFSSIAEAVTEAVKQIQKLDPPGVGAKNLSQCLELQLQRLPGDHTTAIRIVQEHLELLGRRQYKQIAKKLGCALKCVEQAAEEIRGLNPYPTQEFCEKGPVAYVYPDVFLTFENGTPTVFLNDFGQPQIHVNRYYQSLLDNSGDIETQAYLKKKIAQANWLIACFDQRCSTLMACTGAIARLQADFFLGTENDSLHPMNLADIAEKTGLHESTVSRALRGKYLQCERGLYPFRFFFTTSLGTEEGSKFSAQQARQTIAELIRKENPHRPLSDQKLADVLAAGGLSVSRRTVAKYRTELQLGSTVERRKDL